MLQSESTSCVAKSRQEGAWRLGSRACCKVGTREGWLRIRQHHAKGLLSTGESCLRRLMHSRACDRARAVPAADTAAQRWTIQQGQVQDGLRARDHSHTRHPRPRSLRKSPTGATCAIQMSSHMIHALLPAGMQPLDLGPCPFPPVTNRGTGAHEGTGVFLGPGRHPNRPERPQVNLENARNHRQGAGGARSRGIRGRYRQPACSSAPSC